MRASSMEIVRKKMQLRAFLSVLCDILLVAGPEIHATQRPEPNPQPIPMGKVVIPGDCHVVARLDATPAGTRRQPLSPNFHPVHGLILAHSIPCRKFLTT